MKNKFNFLALISAGMILLTSYSMAEPPEVINAKADARDYYSIASGSVGFQMGLQKTSYIIAFASEAALNNFRKSNGWEAGVDGSIAVAKWGAGKDIGSISFEKPIYAFVFGAKGLMYNLTLEGTKFTKIRPH
jgi:lipid-binding SYLF domain-containing protein